MNRTLWKRVVSTQCDNDLTAYPCTSKDLFRMYVFKCILDSGPQHTNWSSPVCWVTSLFRCYSWHTLGFRFSNSKSKSDDTDCSSVNEIRIKIVSCHNIWYFNWVKIQTSLFTCTLWQALLLNRWMFKSIMLGSAREFRCVCVGGGGGGGAENLYYSSTYFTEGRPYQYF